MTAPLSPRRRLALALLRRLDHLLPSSRRDWARAMQAEVDHLPDDRDALAWAVGCVAACAKDRIHSMLTGNLRVSRWILAAEMLLCFAPLTLGWLDAIGGGSGVARLGADIIRKRFLAAPAGAFPLALLIAGAVLGVIGPLGLASALRLVVLGRAPGNRWLRTALVAGPAAYGALTLAARWATAGTGSLGIEAVDSFDFWSGILLLSVLPSLGAAHMLRLAVQS